MMKKKTNTLNKKNMELNELSIQIISAPFKDDRESKREQYQKDSDQTKIFKKERQAKLHDFFYKK